MRMAVRRVLAGASAAVMLAACGSSDSVQSLDDSPTSTAASTTLDEPTTSEPPPTTTELLAETTTTTTAPATTSPPPAPTSPPPTSPPPTAVPVGGDLCSRFEATANPDDDAELATLLDGVGPPVRVWGEADGSFDISVVGGGAYVYRDGNLTAVSEVELSALLDETDPQGGHIEVNYFPAPARLDCVFVELNGD